MIAQLIDIEHLKYPIGKFDFEKHVSISEIPQLMGEIAHLPVRFRKTIGTLTAEQLEVPYRQGGWKVKQVVHHLADSHMNAYMRFQLALTEDNPVIKPYKENLWAELQFKEFISVETSLQMLELIHTNFVILLKSMNPSEFDRTYLHPEYNRTYTLRKALALYAWHGKHHHAHITALIARNFDK